MSSILLIEDDKVLNGVIADCLTSAGHVTHSTSSWHEARKVLEQQDIQLVMSETVPSAMESAAASLEAAQQAAGVLDSAIRSLDTFRTVLSVTPLLGALVEQPEQAYDPQVPLGDSLGELAGTLSTLPDTFTEMAENLDAADDNLVEVQSSLVTMSESVSRISDSLSEYEAMVGQSQASMENLRSILVTIDDNQDLILNGAAIVLSFFFIWLLAAQVVIFSQGWELFQGTADRMEDDDEVSFEVEEEEIEASIDDEPEMEAPETGEDE